MNHDINAKIWAIEAPNAAARGIIGPMYTRSIDASLAVIERRWPGVFMVDLQAGYAEIRVDDTTTFQEARRYSAESSTIAYALALALLAALEAEVDRG